MAASRPGRGNSRAAGPSRQLQQQMFSFLEPNVAVEPRVTGVRAGPEGNSDLQSGGLQPVVLFGPDAEWPLDEGMVSTGDDYLTSLRAAATLDELQRLALTCRRCHLRAGCRGVVFGEGDARAPVMFVGEGPGQTEDELGRPFVGRAGQLLDRWIGLLGLERRQVYITNVVKCRPPGNRTPTPEEARTCWPILRQQLALIRPRILVCLGSPAVQALVHPSARITRMRGSWVGRGEIKLIGTFHPAAVLRDESKQRAVLEDLRKLRAEYLRLTSSSERDA